MNIKHHSIINAKSFRMDFPEGIDILVVEVVPKTWPSEWPVVKRFPYSPNALAQAKKFVSDLDQKNAEQILAARGLSRFLTRWYATTDPDRVEHLCKVDGTSADQVRKTENVSVLHLAGNWAYWSDGEFTKKPSEWPSGYGILSAAAVGLINSVRGSDTGYVEGGLKSLVEIEEVLSKTTLETGADRGVYASEEVERLTCRMRSGAVQSFYTHSAGYFEGYQFDVYLSLDTLKAMASPPPPADGMAQFPGDEFDYDADLGFTKKDD